MQLLEALGDRGVAFHSLTESIDTSTSGGRLVFHFMAALAEFERTLISERTRAGLASARIAGKRIGRLPLLSTGQLHTAAFLRDQGQQSMAEIARDLGVHPRTLQRGLRRLSASTEPSSGAASSANAPAGL